MNSVVLESVTKVFRHRPALRNWIGRERGGETCALAHISFTLKRGEVLALLGPNGSGKTTTLRLLSTLLLPDAGRVMVEGCDTRRDGRGVRAAVGIAVAAERSFYPRLSARENLAFFAALDGLSGTQAARRANAVLDQSGLCDAADTLVMKFSSGMYQRLGIARALMKQPKVLLLDEPTRSLDPAAALQLSNLLLHLRQRDTTILLATHSFSQAAAVADKVAVLRQGKLHDWSDVRGSAEQLQQFYFQGEPQLPMTAELTAHLEVPAPSAHGAWR